MKKRILSLLLAAVMVCGLLPTVAMAASVTQVVPYKYDAVGDFNDGVARVKLNGKWGLVNTAGAEIVPCKYDSISDFSSGVATARLDGKLGLIDKTGAEIVPCGSLDLTGLSYTDNAFYNGRLIALKYVRSRRISEEASPIDIYNWIIVDTAGNQINTGKSMELTYVFGVGYIYNNSAVANAYPGNSDFVGWESSRFKNGCSSLYGGLLDAAGNVIVPPGRYASVSPFSDGFARVKDANDLWGFVDTTGREVVPCQYAEAGDFSEGFARVKDGNGLWGHVDPTGRLVVPCKYKDVKDFTDGKAAVSDRTDQVANGKTVYGWGMVDTSGNLVVPIGEYDVEKDSARFGYHQGLKATQNSNKWGFVNRAGNQIIAARYDKAKGFSNGLAAVYVEDSGWGYIDLHGNEVIPCQHGSSREFHDGMVAVDLDGKWGFVRVEGLPTQAATTPVAPTIGTPNSTEDFSISNGILWKYKGSGGAVVIPDGVTSIEMEAFRDCTGLTSVVIPNSVTSIGMQAFLGCTSLTSMTMGNGVTSIGDHAFYGCTNLTSIAIPDSVTKIRYGAFMDCTGLTSLTIGNGFKEIDWNAFSGCTNLKSVALGNGMTALGGRMFLNCRSLTSVVIPNSVTTIGSYAFDSCSGLASVAIPTGVTSIEKRAFIDCTGLTDVYYGGSQAQWNAIAIEQSNEPLLSANIHFNSPMPDQPVITPTVPTAYASTQTVLVDGRPVTFNAYALKDANGYDTNYIKLRDVAAILNGSAAQFQVGWDGSIAITTNAAYTPNGTEMVQNFTGNQSYTVSTSPVTVNGVATNLEAITLTDASGGGYTYFKLRDLGAALGFNVDWSAEKGIFIGTE